MFTIVTFTMTWIVTFHGMEVSRGTPSFRTEYECQEARARTPTHLLNGDEVRTTECERHVTTFKQ